MASKLGPKPGSLAVLRARYAALTRDRDPDDPELIEARRDFAFARFEGQASDLVTNYPPLTDAQCQRIAAMLKAGTVSRD